jgi:sugar transferase (PEP-CTERM/EpsH1 system associated)
MARLALEPPLAGLPFVLDLVDVDSDKWARMAASSSAPRSWVYRREARTLGAFETIAAQRAHDTLVVNEREAQALLALAPSARVTVISNGIDLEKFRPQGPPSDSRVVSFCGVMDYHPNEEGVAWFAKSVWPLVRRARADARFQIVGARPTRAVRALAEGDPSIEVTGSVPEVEPFLWQSALSVAPLRVAQGLQNKVLEAIAAGLPVVVTPQVAAGLPAILNGALTVSESPDEFARAVVTLLHRSADERRALAATAQLSGLSWEGCLAPLEGILQGAAR